MQTIAEETHICREESKSQLSERGMSSQALPSLMDAQNARHSNECQNCDFVDECKLREEFNESRIEDKSETNFHFSDEVNDFEMKPKTKDIPKDCSKSMSPIEEFRTDGKYCHTSTSTPNGKPILLDLNISSISLEESDSDFLYERQISRFQITDEFINSSVFDDIEDQLN